MTRAPFVVFIGTIGQYRASCGLPRDPFDGVGRFGQALKKNLGGFTCANFI